MIIIIITLASYDIITMITLAKYSLINQNKINILDEHDRNNGNKIYYGNILCFSNVINKQMANSLQRSSPTMNIYHINSAILYSCKSNQAYFEETKNSA